MNRRSLFQALSAFALALVLPPVRAAKASLRRLVNPSWYDGRRPWEHLAVPEHMPASSELYGGRRVCRMLNPVKAPRANIADSEAYLRILLESGGSSHSWLLEEELPRTKRESGET
jgi:hypothetical protein